MTSAISSRFRRVRTLGEGGMGVVYEARDEELGTSVALKTMHTPTPEALARLKKEFRVLKDVHHPNLVTLGELVTEGGECFFTMELVDGSDFLAHVRPNAGAATTRRYDEQRLRRALAQLSEGLSALHGAGLVHRDIKPGNVLVTREGRVVLLDFGLVADTRADESIGDHVVGTPAYMAPEQAASGAPGPEADWYAVGAMLYEALTGRVPFVGAPLEVLLRKQKEQPPAPSEIAGDVPPDLDAICVALLRFDPAERPGRGKILRAVGAATAKSAMASSTQSAPFVGRARELELLDAALHASRKEAVVALVTGESGMGKSCLVRRFLERLALEERSPVVLSGRCYEREAVPYKAVDGVIDALARFLARAPEDEAVAWLPPQLEPLLQVFPVLRRARVVTEQGRHARQDAPQMDHVELRGRAFTALRDLLARIAETRSLVIAVDDLQWADGDSLALLADVLRTPDAPRLLLVATARDGAETTSGVGTAFREALARMGTELRSVPLERLSREDAGELAAALLARAAPDFDMAPTTIGEDAGGRPLFIDAIVRHAMMDASSKGRTTWRAGPLADALWARVQGLDPAARDLVELLAIAGAPLSQDALARAAEARRPAFTENVAYLRVAHLVTLTGGRGVEAIDTYHDEVRSAVATRLDDAARARGHRRLALALETGETRDFEALFTHWRGAGDDVRATKYAEAAADHAAETLGFDHAATLYEAALALGAHAPRPRSALSEKLGDAYANAGQGSLAARAYRMAANGVDSARSLDLRSRATAQLLRSGHFDEGLDAASDVLAEVGLRLARSPLAALLTLLCLRAILALRGLGFRRREASLVSARELTRIDVCESIAWYIAFADPTQGTAFQQRHLLIALRCGEPSRVVRALAAEIGLSALKGTRGWKRLGDVMATTQALADSVGEVRASATTTVVIGVAHYVGHGDFRRALDLCDRGAIALRDCTGVAWELAVSRLYALYSLVYLGRWDELAIRAEEFLRDARARGDLFSVLNGSTGIAACAWLGRDEPARARRDLVDALRIWSRRGFHLAHYFEALGLTLVDLYEGHGDDALARLDSVWPQMRRSFYLRIQAFRIEGLDARGRAMLASASSKGERERARLLAQTRKIARGLHREDARWATAMATLLDAGVAHVEGDRAATSHLLDEAARACDAADMALHASVARWCRASLDGAAPIPRAPVKNFARVVALLAPPFAPTG